MKQPWLKLLAVLFAFALIAAACGDDDDDAGTATEDGSAEDGSAEDGGGGDDGGGEAPAAGEDSGTITILGPETGSEAEGFEAAIDAFEEANGVTVLYSGSRDSSTLLNLAVEGGDPPDISIIPQPGRVVQFAESGDAVPLPQEVLDAITPSYDPFWFDLVTSGDGVYGVPNKGDVKSLVWYSPERFSENGYEIPETFADLEALIETMKADGNTPFCVGIESGDATGWPFTDWMEDMMLRLKGPDVYDQWVNHEIPFNDPQVLEVVEFVSNIWFTEGNVLGGRDVIATTGFQQAGLPLLDGDCMMHRQANFYAAQFVDAGATVGPGGDVDVFYLPTISDEFGTVVLGAGTHAVAFANRPEVMALMQYLGTADYANNRITADKGGFLSPNRDHDTSLYTSDLDRSLAEILVSADPFRFDASDLMPGEVGAGAFWSEGTDYVSGAIEAQEMLDNIEAAWPS